MAAFTFDPDIRTVFQAAREASSELRHEYVGTEHMLLGLLTLPESEGMAVLAALGVSVEPVAERMLESIRPGRMYEARTLIPVGRSEAVEVEVPYTSRAKKVIELSMAAAQSMQQSQVGTGHLVLGLLGETKSIAAVVLNSFGITLEAARSEVLRRQDGVV